MKRCRVWVPNGALGSGFAEESVDRAISLEPDAIALDAGSTDSGPFYLGTGTSKMPREAVKRDLRILLEAREKLGIPLLVGSCGTCGTDSGVQWTRDICLEILTELGVEAKITLLYSEQDVATLARKLEHNRIKPLPPAGPLDRATLEACSHIVAMMGPEPYIRAIEEGADIVLGGRTSDAAVLSAVPLMRGCAPGPTWHAAKVAECGALCTTDQGTGAVIFAVDESGFEIEPLVEDAACTPHTVSVHMLYENVSPYELFEPGGCLDVTRTEYTALDHRRVRVEGAIWKPSDVYTMKLEGAGPVGYQTVMLIGIQDPRVLRHLDQWLENLTNYLRAKIRTVLGLRGDEYSLAVRAYGWNAVTGKPVGGGTFVPREVGVLLVATARTQALATRIAKLCNPYLLHFPLERNDPLPSFAFPFSPPEMERGQVFEFKLNHVVETEDPYELVKVHTLDRCRP